MNKIEAIVILMLPQTSQYLVDIDRLDRSRAYIVSDARATQIATLAELAGATVSIEYESLGISTTWFLP